MRLSQFDMKHFEVMFIKASLSYRKVIKIQYICDAIVYILRETTTLNDDKAFNTLDQHVMDSIMDGSCVDPILLWNSISAEEDEGKNSILKLKSRYTCVWNWKTLKIFYVMDEKSSQIQYKIGEMRFLVFFFCYLTLEQTRTVI